MPFEEAVWVEKNVMKQPDDDSFFLNSPVSSKVIVERDADCRIFGESETAARDSFVSSFKVEDKASGLL